MMPILIDFSPVVHANVRMNLKHMTEDGRIQEDMVNHMIFDSLRAVNKNFGAKYGNPIVCFDSRYVWRKGKYSEYKANRKLSREKEKEQGKDTSMDWDHFWKVLNYVTENVKQNLPWLCIEQENAEADDVIGVLAKHISTNSDEKILITSSDNDFKQLQQYDRVEQYSPIMKKWIVSENPEKDLLEKLLVGDKKDGVPNVKSDDKTFIEGRRQKVCTKKFKDKCLLAGRENIHTAMTDDEYNRFLRNEEMIDLSFTPDSIVEKTIAQYENHEITGNIQSLMSYFSANRLRQLTERLDEFRIQN